MDEATTTTLDSVLQSAKVSVFSQCYSMNYKAPRRSSQARNFGVDRQEGFAADIVPRRPYVPYDNRMKNKWSRSLVWTNDNTNGSTKPPGLGTGQCVSNQPRKNASYGPTKPPALGTGQCVSNQPRKNVSYGPMKSPALGTGQCVSNQPMKHTYYGPRSSSVSDTRGWGSSDKGSPKSKKIVCKFWLAGNCKHGDKCHFLHSWACFPELAMVASLEGHKKDLKGIALPTGSDKLFSASSDGELRIWDCHSGQCVHSINLQAEAGSLISEGSWVFLGLPNAVKAFNVANSKDLHLNGVVGQVHAMIVANEMLFAGTSSGSISVWKATDDESDPFTYLTSLEGHHSGAVTCFIAGGKQVYSGSVDKTIKVWDLNTLECVVTLRQHTDTITSLLCWDQYMLSSSLDGTIKVWACSENGGLKVTNTRRQEQSVHALCGMHDADAKPIIFCSYQNGTVGIYDLPSFEERGKMFSTNTIGTIAVGPEGLLFSGDKSGKLRVWNLAGTKA